MSRRVVLLALTAGAIALVHIHLSAAAFTAAPVSATATIQVDRLSNSFSVTPGTAVQPGTTTVVASGNVDALSLAFGAVPRAQTFVSVFTIRNVSSQARTAQLTVTGVPEIASAVFASSGGTSA